MLCPTVLPEGGGAQGILQPQRPCSSDLGVPFEGQGEEEPAPAGVPRSREGQVLLGSGLAPTGLCAARSPGFSSCGPNSPHYRQHRQRQGLEGQGSELQEAGPARTEAGYRSKASP